MDKQVEPTDLTPGSEVQDVLVKNLNCSLLFGETKDSLVEHVYARYAMGDPISVIASDLKVSEHTVFQMMRKIPDKYEETKQAREAFLGLRLRRSLSLVDAHNLRLMEGITEDRITPTAEQMKDLTRWAKDVAIRLALHEGKPTASVKFDTRESLEDIEAWLTKVRAAGNGLNLED